METEGRGREGGKERERQKGRDGQTEIGGREGAGKEDLETGGPLSCGCEGLAGSLNYLG